MKYGVIAAFLATASAECMKGIKMGVYSDKDCKNLLKAGDEEMPEHEITKEELKDMNKKCSTIPEKDQDFWTAQDFEAVSQKVTCDTEALTAVVYTSEDCTGDDTKDWSQVWGECKEYKIPGPEDEDGEPTELTMYIKVSGAFALKAAATAALALIGSQF